MVQYLERMGLLYGALKKSHENAQDPLNYKAGRNCSGSWDRDPPVIQEMSKRKKMDYNPPFEVNRTMLYVGSKIFQEQITGESSVALLQENRLTIGGYQII